ncbi:MAG: hypothetical protein ACI9QC_000342 [Oceanicoccus sp.]|jgi:hypothetical protein
MVRRRGHLRYLTHATLNKGLQTTFDRALSLDVPRTSCLERVRSVICIDSPGTKCREGGFLMPERSDGTFTVSFVDPLMSNLERGTISRGFLENIHLKEMIYTYKQSLRPHKPTIGLSGKEPKGALFLPFTLNNGLQSGTPYLAPAATEAIFDADQARLIRSFNQNIHRTLRSFSKHWSGDHKIKTYKHLNCEISKLTEAFNHFIARYLIRIGRPFLVESKHWKYQYGLARKPSDLAGTKPRFTGATRNPFAFLNAVQLSLALRGQPDLYEDFPHT